MTILAEAYGSSLGDANWNPIVDLNNDSKIDTDDLDEVFKVFHLLVTDVNGDGVVNILDITVAALAYGSTPESANWNVKVDFNDDQTVNIIDISVAATAYGKRR
jgi:hypothetical protein